MLFSFFFFFTKFDQMSRVGSWARHPKCRAKNHVKRIHESQKICKRCEKLFIVEKLKLHLIECPRVCQTCGKSYVGTKSQNILRTHVKIVHEGRRPHKCETCGKLFGVSSDMKRHVDSVHLKIPNVWKRRSKLKKEDWRRTYFIPHNQKSRKLISNCY